MSRFTDPSLARLKDLLQRCTEAEREQIYRLLEADGETCDALLKTLSTDLRSKLSKGFIRSLQDRYFIINKRRNS
jgi:hypothetical protein